MNRLIQLYNIAISVQQQRQYLTKSFVPFQSNQHIILQTQSPVLGSSQIGSLQNIVYLHKSNVQPTPVVPAPPIHIVPPYI